MIEISDYEFAISESKRDIKYHRSEIYKLQKRIKGFEHRIKQMKSQQEE